MQISCTFPLALQPLKIGIQRGLGAPQNHVVNSVLLQVAQGGGKAFPPGEEVLVDPQDTRALQ
jgi:hypothetical protein